MCLLISSFDTSKLHKPCSLSLSSETFPHKQLPLHIQKLHESFMKVFLIFGFPVFLFYLHCLKDNKLTEFCMHTYLQALWKEFPLLNLMDYILAASLS